MTALVEQTWVPYIDEKSQATFEELRTLRAEVPNWRIVYQASVPHLERSYDFPDFQRALAFAEHISKIAEQEHHYPAVTVEWGKVTVTWWTQTVQWLHRNDFVMAAKTDRAYQLANLIRAIEPVEL